MRRGGENSAVYFALLGYAGGSLDVGCYTHCLRPGPGREDPGTDVGAGLAVDLR